MLAGNECISNLDDIWWHGGPFMWEMVDVCERSIMIPNVWFFLKRIVFEPNFDLTVHLHEPDGIVEKYMMPFC